MGAQTVPPGLTVCREVVVDLAGAREGRLAGAGQEDWEARGSRHPGTEADLSLGTWDSHNLTRYLCWDLFLDLLGMVSTTEDIYTWRERQSQHARNTN